MNSYLNGVTLSCGPDGNKYPDRNRDRINKGYEILSPFSRAMSTKACARYCACAVVIP